MKGKLSTQCMYALVDSHALWFHAHWISKRASYLEKFKSRNWTTFTFQIIGRPCTQILPDYWCTSFSAIRFFIRLYRTKLLLHCNFYLVFCPSLSVLYLEKVFSLFFPEKVEMQWHAGITINLCKNGLFLYRYTGMCNKKSICHGKCNFANMCCRRIVCMYDVRLGALREWWFRIWSQSN